MIRRDMDHYFTATRRKTNSRNRATVLFTETISVLQLSTPSKVTIAVARSVYNNLLWSAAVSYPVSGGIYYLWLKLPYLTLLLK